MFFTLFSKSVSIFRTHTHEYPFHRRDPKSRDFLSSLPSSGCASNFSHKFSAAFYAFNGCCREPGGLCGEKRVTETETAHEITFFVFCGEFLATTCHFHRVIPRSMVSLLQIAKFNCLSSPHNV